jgi:hypothetical protein
MTILRGGSKLGYALANRNATLAITNVTWTAVPFLNQVADTDDIWEGVTNPSRFLSPAWATFVQMGSQTFYEGHTTGQRICTHRLNGSEFNGRGQARYDQPDATWQTQHAWSCPVAVAVPGTDYYEVYTYQSRGSNLNLASSINWGCLVVTGSN